jgi:2-haloacid dehalogenase
VDSVRTFKTTPASYALVGSAFDVQPHEVLFVSSNAWDALGVWAAEEGKSLTLN